jgi:hypothetical protein
LGSHLDHRDELETFFESLGAFAAGTRTKYAQLLKRLFAWAKRKRHIAESPISDVDARKTKKARLIPISDRLAAVLEMRRAIAVDETPAGTAYVFGDKIGARTKSIKKAWETCVLKARGY